MKKIKRSTDDLIEQAIVQQNKWQENRRTFARSFLKKMNVFARPSVNKAPAEKRVPKTRSGIMAYWFPLTCVIIVIAIAIWVLGVGMHRPVHIVMDAPATVNVTATETIKASAEQTLQPSFDIVRIERGGRIVVAGRAAANSNVSVVVNNRVVSTQRTNADGEFVFAPTHAFAPGNYTLSLIGENGKSTENVFLYVSPRGYENSVSLLMTADGSTLLQAPLVLHSGDLQVSKIDYLSNGRIVVTGDSLPRMRVSLSLNDKYLGFARVSDHRHFGLGADVGKLESGKKYTLTIRLHDGDGRTIAQIGHTFVMPKMTGDDDTYYTVRAGDSLWVIARNFMRRGVLFSIIAQRNNILNPHLIFPRQILQIPVGHGIIRQRCDE